MNLEIRKNRQMKGAPRRDEVVDLESDLHISFRVPDTITTDEYKRLVTIKLNELHDLVRRRDEQR